MRALLFGKAEDKARRRFQFVLLALVLALAAIAAGCGGDDGTSTSGAAATGTSASGGACDKEIWVLLPDSASSPRWESDDRPYFDKAFNDAGAKHTIVNAEGDAATQQSQAEQAIAADAGVIVLTSIDTGSGGAIIDSAKEAGVDVIEYDRFNTGSSGGSVYVSFDNVQVGATMAEILEPAIEKLGKDPANVVELNGGEEDNNAFLFKDGYDATVQKHVSDGSWKLVADQFVPGWGANGEGQGIMEQILTDANNKVDAVFAANDNLAQQAINALDAAGVGTGSLERPGRVRRGHPEHPARQSDDDRLQADRGGSRGRGEGRAGAVRRAGSLRGGAGLRSIALPGDGRGDRPEHDWHQGRRRQAGGFSDR